MDKDQPAALVVDDEVLLRLHAAGVLQDNGFEVLEAKDAASALEILSNRPDVKLLFTDIQMPGELNGLELARRVHETWPDVLLIVTSGRLRLQEDDIPDHGRFVAKPYRDQELMDHVNDLMENSPSPEAR